MRPPCQFRLATTQRLADGMRSLFCFQFRLLVCLRIDAYCCLHILVIQCAFDQCDIDVLIGHCCRNPKKAESASIENGTLRVSMTCYEPEGSAACREFVYRDPESAEYKAILTRHVGLYDLSSTYRNYCPDLVPSSIYQEYLDGHWDVIQGSEIIASGNIDERQSEEHRN